MVLEYLDEMKEYGPTYTLWSGSEEELMEPLKLMASCLDRCYSETEEQIEHLSISLLPTLHEYVLCADNLKVLHCDINSVFLAHKPECYRDVVGDEDG